jgi:Ran-binding protein 9/10
MLPGCASRPYPNWRFPGWERLSVGLHLDDFRKFFEDPYGGRDYDSRLNGINPGDTIGFGYQFNTATTFFTWNGIRLRDAFTGIFLPHGAHDVYAAIGVEGENDFIVNFGTELFRWNEGNEKVWKIDSHVGYSASTSAQTDEELPPYSI